MKKMMTAVGLLALTVSAQAEMSAPKLYGKVNTAISYVDQDDSVNQKSFAGAKDIKNSESRIGVKGFENVEGHKVSYLIEVGLNASQSSQLRVRQANITMHGKMGSFSMGKGWIAGQKAILSIDPLAGTILASIGDDQKQLVENMSSKIGYKYRSRAERIYYSSPKIMGLKYEISMDKKGQDDSNQLDSTKAGGVATHYNHLFSYAQKFGESMKLDLHVGYEAFPDSDTKDNSTLNFGAKLAMGGMTFSGGLSTTETSTNTTTAVKTEDQRVLLGASYKMGKHYLGLSYAKRENTVTNTTGFDDSQIGIGYAHSCTKNMTLRLMVAKLEHKETGIGASTLAKDQADASLSSLGMTFKF